MKSTPFSIEGLKNLSRQSSDTLFSLLFSAMNTREGSTLVLLDENTGNPNLPIDGDSTWLISNRYDTWQRFTSQLEHAYFSDFDFQTCLPDGLEFDTIIYRISKEKPLVHWILNNVTQRLKSNGCLILGGRKDEGIKSFVQHCNKQLALRGKEKKHGSDYVAQLHRSESISRPLDDKQYAELRAIGEAFGKTIYSKPGQFGWNKIDQGSALLAATFTDWLNDQPWRDAVSEKKALDLGCGYGYLSLALAAEGFGSIIATDNNAAAIYSCERNLHNAETKNVSVVAANCADSITEKVDLVLCNPPFHQGFANESALTERFVQAAANRLNPSGTALFVVNGFIAIEKQAAKHFGHCQRLADTGRFKVLLMQA